jgi:hypothetical protein
VEFVKVKPCGSFSNGWALEVWFCIAFDWFFIESGRVNTTSELSIFSFLFATEIIVFEKRLCNGSFLPLSHTKQDVSEINIPSMILRTKTVTNPCNQSLYRVIEK